MSKIKETTLEVNLTALDHNYHYFQSKLTPGVRTMGVVKAFAYGSDAVEIAKKLVDLEVDYIAVAYTAEGVALRKGGIKKPILVFYPQPVHHDLIIQHQLIPTIYSPSTLTHFIDTLHKTDAEVPYPIHINFNTGMNRLGFSESDLPYLKQTLQATTAVTVDGIYSHFATSDDLKQHAFTLAQLKNFKALSSALTATLPYSPLLHLCNTSGILNYPEAHLDMVRLGIGLYGYSNAEKEDTHLQPTTRLKTIISQIHHLDKGESVGYNRRFVASKPMRIAALPIGYADGFHRAYSNDRSHVIINGQPAPIIGDICMDMMMIDLKEIDCNEGDEVEIFGQIQSAEEFAKAVGSISYEIITGLSQRINRIVIV